MQSQNFVPSHSNHNFQPRRERKAMFQKPKTAKETPIVVVPAIIEEQPNIVIEVTADAKKPRKPRHEKPVAIEAIKIIFNNDTIVLPMSSIDVNGEVALEATTLAVTNDNQVVLNGLLQSGLKYQVVDVQSMDNATIITFVGEIPEEELLFVLANAQLDSNDNGTKTQKKFRVYGKEASRSILIDAGEITILDRIAAFVGNMILSVNDNNDVFQYNRKDGTWETIEIPVDDDEITCTAAAA